jgi:acetyl esterase/lipase
MAAGIRMAVAIVLSTLLLTACSRLATFDAVVPKDGGVERMASGIAYGGDPRQKLDVYAPISAGGKVPVVVFLYGGSWNSGSRKEYDFAARAIASRGFVVVVPDYRLVPDIRYPAFVEDSAAAVAWAYRHAGRYGGDARTLSLVGHSAGAYNAMMLALAPEFLGAVGLKPSMLHAVAGISGPYDFLPLAVRETQAAFKGVADLPSTQPVHRVRRGVRLPPILLQHGRADDFVYPRNSEALAKRLRAAGHGVEERYYDGIGHAGTLLALSRPLRGRAPVLDDLVTFLSKR